MQNLIFDRLYALKKVLYTDTFYLFIGTFFQAPDYQLVTSTNQRPYLHTLSIPPDFSKIFFPNFPKKNRKSIKNQSKNNQK